MITQRTMHIALVRACVLLSWLAAIVAADGDESLCERKEKGMRRMDYTIMYRSNALPSRCAGWTRLSHRYRLIL